MSSAGAAAHSASVLALQSRQNADRRLEHPRRGRPALYPDTETALGVWRALREDNLRLCAWVSSDDRDRMGQIPWNEKGISFGGYVASRGHHDLNHIEQIRAALTG